MEYFAVLKRERTSLLFAGHYIPPMFIYPHIWIRPEFLDSGPVGAIVKGNKTGRITAELFAEWFVHFIKHMQPKSLPEPTLLLADGQLTCL